MGRLKFHADAKGTPKDIHRTMIFADPIVFPFTQPPARWCLSDDPLQRLAFVDFIVGSYLRMQEHPDCAYHPMLPVVCGNDSDALDLLVMVFYEPDKMIVYEFHI